MRLEQPPLVGCELFDRVIHRAQPMLLAARSDHAPPSTRLAARLTERRREMPDGTAARARARGTARGRGDASTPPPEFAAQANASDPAIYEEAERDPEGWWESWAREARLGRALGRRCSSGTRPGPSGSSAAS